MEGDDFAGFHFQGDDAEHLARRRGSGPAPSIRRRTGLRTRFALVQRVQHGVTGARSAAAQARRTGFAEVRHVATERTLVDLAVSVRSKGMPKCSARRPPALAAFVNSIASWSPSQSDP